MVQCTKLWDTRVFPNKQSLIGLVDMSFIQTVRAIATKFSTQPSQQDALESYLGQSQSHSIADLEFKERQWLRAQSTSNPFAPSY
jgi:hypothetical protein